MNKAKLTVWKIKIYLIVKEIFQYSLVTYLILLLAESIKEGIVSYFFNLNILLGVVLISGIIMILTYDERLMMKSPSKRKSKIDIVWSIVFAVGGGALVVYKTMDLGVVSLVVGSITGIIIVLLSLLLLNEK